MRKNKIDFFQPGGKKFLNGDKPDQDTFEDLTDSTTFPTELTDRAKVSESGLTKTTTDLKVNTGDDTDQSGISPLGFPVIVKPSQLWRLSTSDPQVVLTAVTRVPGSPVDSEDGSLIEDIEISLNVTPPVAAVTGADNGLTLLGNNVELGGTMTHNTTITGSAVKFWFLLIENLFEFSVKDVDQIELVGDVFAKIAGSNYVRIETTPTTGEIQILTPLLATSNPGYVLTLLDIATGECEWQAIPGGGGPAANIYNTDDLLTGNRQLGGSGFNLTLDNVLTFATTGTSNIDLTSIVTASLVSPTVTIDGSSQLFIKTPLVGSGTPPSIGDVLTLSNAVTGECEWIVTPAGADTNIYNVDGDLDADRTLRGLSLWFLKLIDLTAFEVNSQTLALTQSGSVSIDAPTINIASTTLTSIEGQGAVQIKTPLFFVGTPPLVGDILTLTNATTGECEWQAPAIAPPSPRYVQTFAPADWVTPSVTHPGSGFDITITAATHGRGPNPIVQVQIDPEPYNPLNTIQAVIGTDQNGAAGPFTVFSAVTVDSVTGDVLITNYSTYGAVYGKVIIM